MAASTSALPIDPSKPAKYPVSISEQLLREDGPRKRRRVNVQLNHKPKLAGSSTKSIITTSSRGIEHGYNLSVTDENNGNKYLYNGCQQPSSATALIYDSANGSFTLDKIDTEFRFNLRSTPTNNEVTSLATQYPQLETGLQEPDEDENGDDLFDEHSEGYHCDNEEPDPSNPYDYRHFLKSARPGRSPSPELSMHGSPMPSHNANSSPLFTGSSSTRPSHPPKPNKRRSQPRPRHLSPNPREEADADNEDSEADDVLTIDMGDSATTTNARPWRSVLGALNEGRRGSGPISLRSAASSMSPSLRGDTDNEEDKRSNADVEKFDLGDGGTNVVSQGSAAEEVEAPDVPFENDDQFAAQLEQQLINEALSEAEQEDNGSVREKGDGFQVNRTNGTEERRVLEESSEESEEE